MKKKQFFLKAFVVLITILMFYSCSQMKKDSKFTGAAGEVKLIVLDPGHFHAHLVQKTMYPGIDTTVHVYAPNGPEVQDYLARIESYNNRDDNPTSWNQVVYLGDDYLEKMLSERKGNLVVLAGNNKKKTEYIQASIDAGFNVLSDKPMAINHQNFNLLVKAFGQAGKNNLLLYDIMTERFEITSILQKKFSLLPTVFGDLQKGSPDNPAITKESVHYFYKYVSGNPLKRPPWYFDVNQQGDGIVDVTTHLVDLVQWTCFPESIIDFESEIELISARRWPTEMTLAQFEQVTGESAFPEYLITHLNNSSNLSVYANGEMHYIIRGIHAKVVVKWDYQAPEGAGDTHYSIMRGSKANLVIRQGAGQNYKPVLYIEPLQQIDAGLFEEELFEVLPQIQAIYPGIDVKKNNDNSWEVTVPEKYDVGHEAHFAQVTENYLKYLVDGKLPDWEIPNMIAKYYVTTRALELAKRD